MKKQICIEDIAEELEEEIEASDCYERLPNQYEIHEWRIMEAFALGVTSERKQERLLLALHGRKAYRHFKDEIINLGIDEEYYAYRFQALCKIVEEWCEENEIPYTTREEQDNYSLLSYGNKNGFQIDLLLNEARYRNAYPLYMFYTTTQPDITEQIKNIQFIEEETLRWCEGCNNACFLSDAGSISEILFNLPRHKIFDIEILNHSLKLSFLDKLFQDLSKSGHLLNELNQRLIKLGGMDSQYKDGIYGIKHSGRGIPNYLKIFVERQGQDLSWLEREIKFEMGEIGGVVVIDLRE